jgi:hypothetical protein
MYLNNQTPDIARARYDDMLRTAEAERRSSELQQRLLALVGLGSTCYERLVAHSSEPPG